MFTLNQSVTVTQNGKTENASFIGYMQDGHFAQVCMRERKFKPNVIVPTGQLADLIQGAKPKHKPAAVLNAQNTAPV